MIRTALLWFLVVGGLGVALFLMKYELQEREARLESLQREILATQEAIHVLKAEWSYLNRPERISSLVERHLEMVPLTERRAPSLEMLPMKLPLEGVAEDEGVAGGPPLPDMRPALASVRKVVR